MMNHNILPRIINITNESVFIYTDFYSALAVLIKKELLPNQERNLQLHYRY